MVKKENCEQLQEEKPLEEMFAELDLLAEKLENRDTSLEDSFILYRHGHGTFETLQREARYSGEEKCCSLMRMVHLVNFQDELAKRTEETEKVIRSFLPAEAGFAGTMAQAMNYSMLAGGKRLRPMLIRETYRLFDGKEEVVKPFMAGMEMIHTHS